MGCHTWFYKPLDINQGLKDTMLKALDKFVKHMNNTGFYNRDPSERYGWENYWTRFVDNPTGFNAEMKQIRKQILQGDINEYILEWFYPKLTTEYGGKLYEVVDGFHDIFRVYDYPDDVLTSYKETVEYLKKKGYEVCMHYDTLDNLRKFWKKYPNGIIKFG